MFLTSPLVGSGVKDPNFTLRFCIIAMMGVCAFGAVLYWRAQTLLAAEYVDIPTAVHAKAKAKLPIKQPVINIEE